MFDANLMKEQKKNKQQPGSGKGSKKNNPKFLEAKIKKIKAFCRCRWEIPVYCTYYLSKYHHSFLYCCASYTHN